MLNFLFLLAFCWNAVPTLSQISSSNVVSTNVNDLRYYYYPSADVQVEIVYNDVNSLAASNLKANTPTVIVIDGYLSNSTSAMSILVKDAYTNSGRNVNVIVLDWGRLSGANIPLGNPLVTTTYYSKAMNNVQPVGQRLAQFFDFLRVNKQIQFSDIVIVGHSLGAHVAGQAGLTVKTNYSSTISEIHGLDPAGPFYSLQLDADKRLDKIDATFVSVYHTARGTLGTTDDNGDANLYINGGTSQPGCTTEDITGQFKGYCSHSYSWEIYAASFTNTITACPCSIQLLVCLCLNCEVNCNNGIVLGPDMQTSASGTYYVTYGPLNG